MSFGLGDQVTEACVAPGERAGKHDLEQLGSRQRIGYGIVPPVVFDSAGASPVVEGLRAAVLGQKRRGEAGEIEPRVDEAKAEVRTQRALDHRSIEECVKRNERRFTRKPHESREPIGR